MCLAENVPNHVNTNIGPPPDLNPLDLYIWDVVKQKTKPATQQYSGLVRSLE